MDLIGRWGHLDQFCEAASKSGDLQVWLFGSALRSSSPADLDVLVIYVRREDVMSLKNAKRWGDFDPPLHLIAMTASEERFYRFKAATCAVRLA